MFRFTNALFAVILGAGAAIAQGTPALTTIGNLGLRQVTIGVPPRYAATVKTPLKVNIPEGFKADLFYMGMLSKPRFMAFGPDSVLFVANQGSNLVLALPDRDHDGVADTAIVAATGLGGVHDVKFFRGAMYATTSSQVIKLTDADGDLVYETRSVFIDSIAATATNPTGGHSTRTVLFDSAGGNMFLSIGSSCNACRDAGRGVIERYDLAGMNRRPYATGVRNAVGLALHPVTGRLWANNNGNDNQGDNVPPEWIDMVRDGGFYGWPFAYGYQTYNDFTVSGYTPILPLTSADSAQVSSMIAPAALIQAHSAPLGLEFATPAFPQRFRDGMFTALHGSWNRSVPTGYKVVFLSLSGPHDTLVDSVSNFLTGFTADSVAKSDWARPAGILVDLRGNLFVTSDADSQFVLRISPETSVSVADRRHIPSFRIDRVGVRTFRIAGAAPGAFSMDVRDLSGRLVASLQDASDRLWKAPRELSGAYWVSVTGKDGAKSTARIELVD